MWCVFSELNIFLCSSVLFIIVIRISVVAGAIVLDADETIDLICVQINSDLNIQSRA